MATQVEEPEITLTAPDPVPVVAPEKASGLVPLAEGQKSQLEEKAESFVNDLAALDPNSPEFGKMVDQLTVMGRKEIAEAAGQSDEAADPAADAPDHGVGEWLAKRLVKATGAEARATVLGHVQRGAMPTAEDRLLASALGVRAVDLLAEGKADRMVAWWNRQVIDVPLEKVVGKSRTVDPDGTLILTARALGICLGDTA